MKQTLGTYWRLSVKQAKTSLEVFDLRSKPTVTVGDDGRNDVCIGTTAIPFRFKVVKMGRKGPILSLTNEVKESLKGEFAEAKTWKNKLYQGADFLINGKTEWKIADAKFTLTEEDILPMEVVPTAMHPLEKKHWRQSFNYTASVYAIILALLFLLSFAVGLFKNKEEELAVQKITVADVKKVLQPKPLVVDEPPPVVQEVVNAPLPKEQPKELPKMAEKQKKSVKSATAPKAAPGAGKGSPKKSVTSMGLFAIQTTPGPSRVSVSAASGSLVASRPTKSSDMRLGLGSAASGAGVTNSNGTRLASLGSYSGTTYQGGLGDSLQAARTPSLTITKREVEIRGALDPNVIRQIIEERLSEIRYCYENALLQKTGLSGKVAASWTIAPDGSVTNLQTASDEINQNVLHPCVKTQIRGWKFPSPKGGGLVHVRYPFVFSPAGGLN